MSFPRISSSCVTSSAAAVGETRQQPVRFGLGPLQQIRPLLPGLLRMRLGVDPDAIGLARRLVERSGSHSDLAFSRIRSASWSAISISVAKRFDRASYGSSARRRQRGAGAFDGLGALVAPRGGRTGLQAQLAELALQRPYLRSRSR